MCGVFLAALRGEENQLVHAFGRDDQVILAEDRP
jgi:hypothetical protein